jgi:MFS family permease
MTGDPTARRVGRGWVTRELVAVTAVSLTQDMASEFLVPLLPLLVTGVLAAPPVVVGAIEGIAEVTAGLTRYLSGRWSDRRGRRPFIAVGYALGALGKVVVAAAPGWGVVLAGRVVDRLGKGVRAAPRDALIAAVTPGAAIGRAFGFHRAGDTLGAVLGPLLALVALEVTDGDVRAALWWAVVPAVGSALLTLGVREPGRGCVEEPPDAHPSAGRAAALPRPARRVAAVLVVVALAGVPVALVLVRVHQLGHTTTDVVVAYVLFNLVAAALAEPAGVLADRWSRCGVYAVGLAAAGVAHTGLGLVGHGAPVFALVALGGVFPACTDGVGRAWVSALVPPDLLGRALGTVLGLQSVALLGAGLWAGLAWSTGPGRGAVPLVVAGVLALAAAVAMGSAGRRFTRP